MSWVQSQFWQGYQIFILTLFKSSFSGRVTFKQGDEQKVLYGVRGHAFRKLFENLPTVMAISVLFEQLLR